jgi:ankyrin repeat protein
VKVLVEHNADLNKSDTDKWTPLMFASQEGHANVAQFLVENGAEINGSAKEGCACPFLDRTEECALVVNLLLGLKPCHVCDGISAVAEFMVDVAGVETLPCV